MLTDPSAPPSYPAARAVTAQLRAKFAHQPPAIDMERIIDASFWASLRREEGLSPTISLAYLPPVGPEHSVVLEIALPLTPEALTRLAPAVVRPGIHLGVWPSGDTLSVWGATSVL